MELAEFSDKLVGSTITRVKAYPCSGLFYIDAESPIGEERKVVISKYYTMTRIELFSENERAEVYYIRRR